MGGSSSYEAPNPLVAGGLASMGAGSLYRTAAKYQPQFMQLALNTAASGAPQVMQTLRSYNPQAAGLLDTLTSQVGNQLQLNGALDPATQRGLQQSVRGSQAARGLGYGPGDAAYEQLYQTQTQEARRQQNQTLAGQVAQMNKSYYGDPFQTLLGYGAGSQMPDLSSLFGMMYNGQAAMDTANTNQKNAQWSGLSQGLGNVASGLFAGLLM